MKQYLDIFGLTYFKDKIYQAMEQILPGQTINDPIGNGLNESCVFFDSVPLGTSGFFPDIPETIVSVNPKKTLLNISTVDGNQFLINNVGKHIIYNSKENQLYLFLSNGISFYSNSNIVINGYITFQHT